MTETTVSLRTKTVLYTLATLMFVRGILILFLNDNATVWNNLLGIGGLEAAASQFGILGTIIKVVQLIEGRLWIIVAFPIVFRLPWGRDVTILVAGLGMIVQVFRLLVGSDTSASAWLVIYAAIALLFYADSGIKAYFAQAAMAELSQKSGS